MPTVVELSDPYANFMVNPLPPEADGVCIRCLTFTAGYDTCYPCSRRRVVVDALLPISYSVHLGQLHTALRGYKDSLAPVSQRFTLELAAVLWRFLDRHEGCLAARVGVSEFEVVATVPSTSPERDETHPLHRIVGTIVGHTRDRYGQLLRPSGKDIDPREFDPRRYVATQRLAGESILLIDDTWTTGANVESAAAVLREAGAGRIGAVVIGRHVREDFGDNAVRLRALPRFSWERCTLG